MAPGHRVLVRAFQSSRRSETRAPGRKRCRNRRASAAAVRGCCASGRQGPCHPLVRAGTNAVHVFLKKPFPVCMARGLTGRIAPSSIRFV